MYDTNPLGKLSLEEKIQLKIAEIDAIADSLPGVVIIHNLQKELTPEYLSPRGEHYLGISNEELRRIGNEYNYKYFNPEDAKDYIPKVFGLMERNDEDEIVSFFQQVRPSENEPWTWHLSTMKILMRDEKGAPLLSITFAAPIDPLHHVTTKVTKLLEENNFLRKNLHKFKKLSDREQEVLRAQVLGKSASETAEELFISVATVETHRRNLKKKLKTNSSFELTQYARAFDLI